MGSSFYQGCDGSVETRNIKVLPKALKLYDGKWVSELKCDGIFATMVSDGRPSFFSRTGLRKRVPDLERVKLPSGLVVAAELGYGQEAAVREIKSKGHSVCRVYRLLKFPHSMMVNPTADLDALKLNEVQQREALEIIWRQFRIDDCRFPLMPRWKNDHFQHYLDVVQSGGEGIILKCIDPLADTSYRPGTRSSLWLKVKKTVELDMVILGMELSDAFGGARMAKHVVCGMYVKDAKGKLVLQRMCDVGTMTEYWRREFADHIDKYLGKVITIGGNEVFESGAVRHPFFLSLRDDKNPEECVY